MPDKTLSRSPCTRFSAFLRSTGTRWLFSTRMALLAQGPRDTATVALIISAFAVWCTAMQCGPFARPSLNDSFILSLTFMMSTSMFSLALSTDVAMRQELTRALSTELALRRLIEDQRQQCALETEVLWQATAQVASG